MPKTQSSRETVWATENPLERAGYEAILAQDPNNIEAEKGLEAGIYDKITFVAKKTINDVYHLYKVENGVPKLIASTSSSVYKRTFEHYRFYKGSVAPIEEKLGITFAGYLAGEEFDSTKIQSYFEKQSMQQVYARKVKDIEQYYDLLW